MVVLTKAVAIIYNTYEKVQLRLCVIAFYIRHLNMNNLINARVLFFILYDLP